MSTRAASLIARYWSGIDSVRKLDAPANTRCRSVVAAAFFRACSSVSGRITRSVSPCSTASRRSSKAAKTESVVLSSTSGGNSRAAASASPAAAARVRAARTSAWRDLVRALSLAASVRACATRR